MQFGVLPSRSGLGPLQHAYHFTAAGTAQTVLSYEARSFLKLGPTKPVTTVQAAASLVCDMLITVFLCAFLKSQKGDLMKHFLALPDTLWFFIGLAANSKLYMNSMLATLNTRQYIRDKSASNDNGWNSIQMGTLATRNTHKKIHGQASFAAVDLEMDSGQMDGKREELPA
ncbi:hypothetical protein K438DRAFT_1986852 [Mycena galopus ATCC 62051]|nr:hypothetical protein K438DRAFT_1986852 [Mycena galopus ATCC 62051]